MLYPLKFEPILKTVVWGGEKIAPYKGLHTSQTHIGESWELSGVPGSESVIANGPLAGKTLGEAVQSYGSRLTGGQSQARYGDTFPLLIKFIDAARPLSVQVHPNDAMALRLYGKPTGKTEMWYVVDAAPGAYLYAGLRAPLTPESYARRVADGTILDVLARHEVKAGDVFYLPAGRIHAIGEGCFIAEIQQTSDITYRIFDYNRTGLDGKPRPLHTDLAREAIDYTLYPSYKTDWQPAVDTEVQLVQCPYFTTSVYDLTQPLRKDLRTLDSFVVVMCIQGSGELEDSEPGGVENSEPGGLSSDSAAGPTKGHRITLRQGQTVLIPASSSGIWLLPHASGMKVLTAHLG